MIRSRVRRFIASNEWISRKLLAIFVRMHNYSYHKVSELAGFLNKGIHPKHFITHYHAFFVDNVSGDDRVVDLGSGSGYLAFDVAKKARLVFGVDISSTNVENARRDYKADNLEFVVGDITTFPVKEMFDKAILSNVLEHIENRIELLKKVTTFAPVLLVRVPMITRDWITVYKKQEGFEYRLDETHFIEYTLKDFYRETEAGGWKISSLSVNWGEIWAVLEQK